VRVRTIRRRHMMEHSSQNGEFGIRLPRTRSLSVGLRASRESCGQRYRVAEDQQHESQCDELPAIGPDVVDFEVWRVC
jgi:hypothetical protein